jgi:hypothetical protein
VCVCSASALTFTIMTIILFNWEPPQSLASPSRLRVEDLPGCVDNSRRIYYLPNKYTLLWVSNIAPATDSNANATLRLGPGDIVRYNEATAKRTIEAERMDGEEGRRSRGGSCIRRELSTWPGIICCALRAPILNSRASD